MTFHLRRLAPLGLVLGLAACATDIPGANDDATLSTERFKVAPTSEPDEVRLAIHAQGLSAQQAAALAGLVARWRAEEAGVIAVQAPNQGVDPAAAYRMSESARALLIDHGVPADQVELIGYDPQGEASAPLRVGYLRYKVAIPKCGQAWTSMTGTMNNEVHPNFGCAVTANMAAQIANPADLAGPRAITPQDATRRQVVLDKYRRGEVTGAAADSRAQGVVSQAVR